MENWLHTETNEKLSNFYRDLHGRNRFQNLLQQDGDKTVLKNYANQLPSCGRFAYENLRSFKVVYDVTPTEYDGKTGAPDEIVILYRALTGATLMTARHELSFIHYLKTRKYLK